MSHVNNWKKSLIAVVVAATTQVAIADDPAPAFMQYQAGTNKQESTSGQPITPQAPKPTNIKPNEAAVESGKPTPPKIANAEAKAVKNDGSVSNIAPEAKVGVMGEKPSLPATAVVSAKPTAPVPVVNSPLPVTQNAPQINPAAPVNLMDGRFHPATHLSPDTLSEQERMNQLRKSAAESEAALWQAKAKQAQAQAAYEEAMKKITDVRMPPPPPVDPKAEAAIAQLNEMASKQGFHGIKIMSTYGETNGKMYADVMFNGTPMTVARGDKLGEWRVIKVSTTYIKVAKKDEQKDLFIHTN